MLTLFVQRDGSSSCHIHKISQHCKARITMLQRAEAFLSQFKVSFLDFSLIIPQMGYSNQLQRKMGLVGEKAMLSI